MRSLILFVWGMGVGGMGVWGRLCMESKIRTWMNMDTLTKNRQLVGADPEHGFLIGGGRW